MHRLKRDRVLVVLVIATSIATSWGGSCEGAPRPMDHPCEGRDGVECTSDGECPSRNCSNVTCTCVAPECAESDECRSDADCTAPEVCNGVCRCAPVCTASDECRTNADCTGSICTDCRCVNMCTPLDDCIDDAECPPSMRCNPETCMCEGSPTTPLTPENLETLTTGGLSGTCHFMEERGCTVGMFDATLVCRATPMMVELVQMPGAQTTTGAFVTGVRFFTRSSGMAYDEVYIGEFVRPTGIDPMAPLTPETVDLRAYNVSGPPGSLAAIDTARIATGLADGAHTGNSAAIDAYLAGTTDACGYTVVCTYGTR